VAKDIMMGVCDEANLSTLWSGSERERQRETEREEAENYIILFKGTSPVT
jgi:hypothetical protein